MKNAFYFTKKNYFHSKDIYFLFCFGNVGRRLDKKAKLIIVYKIYDITNWET